MEEEIQEETETLTMTNNRLYTDFIVSSERSLTKNTATSEIIIKNSKSWREEEPNFQSSYIIIFKKCNLNKNAQDKNKKENMALI